VTEEWGIGGSTFRSAAILEYNALADVIPLMLCRPQEDVAAFFAAGFLVQ
jgi:hypothetical protein